METAKSFSPLGTTPPLTRPKAKEIFQVGSICNIVQSVKMPDGNIKVLVEGVERAKTIEVSDRDGFFVATVRTGKTDFEMTPAVEQLMQRVTSLFEQYVKLQQSLNYETIIATVRMDEPAKLSDTIAANLQLGIEEAGPARHLRSGRSTRPHCRRTRH